MLKKKNWMNDFMFGKTLAALASIAFLYASSAKANILLSVGPIDNNGNFITQIPSSSVSNYPSRIGVKLSSTNEPTRRVHDVSYDIIAGNLTNYFKVNNGQLKTNETSDVFYGVTLKAANPISTNINSSGLMITNSISANSSSGGNVNKNGLLAVYDMSTFTGSTAYGVSFNLTNFIVGTATGSGQGGVFTVNVNRINFDILPVAEPASAGIGAGIAAAVLAARRKERLERIVSGT